MQCESLAAVTDVKYTRARTQCNTVVLVLKALATNVVTIDFCTRSASRKSADCIRARAMSIGACSVSIFPI